MRPSDERCSIPENLEIEEGNNHERKIPENEDSPGLELKSNDETNDTSYNRELNFPLNSLEHNNPQQSFHFSFNPGWKMLSSSETKDEENLRRSATIDNSTIRPLLRHSSTIGRISRYNNQFLPSSP